MWWTAGIDNTDKGEVDCDEWQVSGGYWAQNGLEISVDNKNNKYRVSKHLNNYFNSLRKC